MLCGAGSHPNNAKVNTATVQLQFSPSGLMGGRDIDLVNLPMIAIDPLFPALEEAGDCEIGYIVTFRCQ
jgi:hypothetical protein